MQPADDHPLHNICRQTRAHWTTFPGWASCCSLITQLAHFICILLIGMKAFFQGVSEAKAYPTWNDDMGGLAKDEAGVIRLCRSSSLLMLFSLSRSATSLLSK